MGSTDAGVKGVSDAQGCKSRRPGSGDGDRQRERCRRDVGGEYFALSRRCRHLGADLADGSIDEDGCLVCPWHHAAYDVDAGHMVRGPQGIFALVPGLGTAFELLTHVLPLRRAAVEVRGKWVYVDD